MHAVIIYNNGGTEVLGAVTVKKSILNLFKDIFPETFKFYLDLDTQIWV